jgi:hypothetical protein
MKKLVIALLLLSLTRIGVAYADTTNPETSQDYFFGTKQAAANLNQVLALLVGPEGAPGPAGVAGKDGLIGLNGVDGLDGAPGAAGVDGKDGVDGRDGISVASAAFTGVQGTCTNGGTKLTDATGTVTFICNGANGAPGPAGANGTNGINGGGGGGALTYGQGIISVGACDTDGVVAFDVKRKYNGYDFVFSQFTVGDTRVTDGDVDAACNNLTFSIYITITPTVAVSTTRMYQPGDLIVCSKVITASPWPTTNPQFSFTDQETPGICKISSRTTVTSTFISTNNLTVPTTVGSTLAIEEISTADYTDQIGFSIG